MTLVYFYSPAFDKLLGTRKFIGNGDFDKMSSDATHGLIKSRVPMPVINSTIPDLEMRRRAMSERNMIMRLVAEYEDVDFDKPYAQYWFPTESAFSWSKRVYGVDSTVYNSYEPDDKTLVEVHDAVDADKWLLTESLFSKTGASMGVTLPMHPRFIPLNKRHFSATGWVFRAGYDRIANKVYLSKQTYFDADKDGHVSK